MLLNILIIGFIISIAFSGVYFINDRFSNTQTNITKNNIILSVIQKLLVTPKIIIPPPDLKINNIRRLEYTLNGKNDYIDFKVSDNLNNWAMRQIKRSYYNMNISSIRPYYTNKRYVLNVLGYKTENLALNQLVYQIQSITPNRNKQVMIAVSLVQNIPYNYNIDKSINAIPTNIKVYPEQLPYQVIYNLNGVCGSKSILLVYLLKQLGFNTAIFYFKEENHEAVGIKSLSQYAYKNTGYAYIETDIPTIITYSSGRYGNGNIKLNSVPEVIKVSNGYTFNATILFKNNLLYGSLINDISKNNTLNNHNYKLYVNLYNKYGLKTNKNKYLHNPHMTYIFYLSKELNIWGGVLPDHNFYYIRIPTNISKLQVLVNATKPISVFVLNGNYSKIVKSYTHNQLLMNSVVKNCKSNNFKKYVNFTCNLWDGYTVSHKYSSLGVLINNGGMGNNIIKMIFSKED